jgi:hypothetical protein
MVKHSIWREKEKIQKDGAQRRRSRFTKEEDEIEEESSKGVRMMNSKDPGRGTEARRARKDLVK